MAAITGATAKDTTDKLAGHGEEQQQMAYFVSCTPSSFAVQTSQRCRFVPDLGAPVKRLGWGSHLPVKFGWAFEEAEGYVITEYHR